MLGTHMERCDCQVVVVVETVKALENAEVHIKKAIRATTATRSRKKSIKKHGEVVNEDGDKTRIGSEEGVLETRTPHIHKVYCVTRGHGHDTRKTEGAQVVGLRKPVWKWVKPARATGSSMVVVAVRTKANISKRACS